LIALRKTNPALRRSDKDKMKVTALEDVDVLVIQRWSETHRLTLAANLSAVEASFTLCPPGGQWRKIFDSAQAIWQGGGSVLPDALEGEVETRLTLAPRSFGVFDCAAA
jgi:maltooligosyltrehalose trehalohydrolase